MKYDSVNPPPIFNSPFDGTKQNGRDYFDWFLSIKDERLKVLEKGIRSTKGFQSWKANFTPASLDSLSDWFKSVIKVRKRSQEEINREKEKLKKPFKNLKIDNETLTGETVSIAFDVGIYLGEVFIRNNKHLSWSIFQKSKRSINYNQIVVAGFESGGLNVRRIPEIQTEKFLCGKGVDFLRLYKIWLEYLPKE